MRMINWALPEWQMLFLFFFFFMFLILFCRGPHWLCAVVVLSLSFYPPLFLSFFSQHYVGLMSFIQWPDPRCLISLPSSPVQPLIQCHNIHWHKGWNVNMRFWKIANVATWSSKKFPVFVPLKLKCESMASVAV